jgi:hypothetical protein
MASPQLQETALRLHEIVASSKEFLGRTATLNESQQLWRGSYVNVTLFNLDLVESLVYWSLSDLMATLRPSYVPWYTFANPPRDFGSRHASLSLSEIVYEPGRIA